MDDPMSPAPSGKVAASLTETLMRISADLEAEQTLKEVRLAVPSCLLCALTSLFSQQSIKESLQPLDTLSRSVTALINRVHSTPSDQRESDGSRKRYFLRADNRNLWYSGGSRAADARSGQSLFDAMGGRRGKDPTRGIPPASLPSHAVAFPFSTPTAANGPTQF